MSLVKRITRSSALRSSLCWLGAQYIRLVLATGRWQVIGADIPERFWAADKPFILAFWHGRLLLMPYVWPKGKAMHMLISQHRDGQIIARTIAHFGIGAVAGSTSRGGSQALRGMLKLLKGGAYIGITPDGPRGPRMRVSLGIVNTAKLSGAPIIPISMSVKRRKVLGSWDRFILAPPFSEGVFVWGRPIEVPRDADAATLEALRLEVETRMNALTLAADSRMGHAPIDPADWPAPPAAAPAAPDRAGDVAAP